MGDVTRIIQAIGAGDSRAADELLTVVYDELRRLAQRKLAQERPGQTLQATALVHEAYLRLIGGGATDWQSRRHFFAAAAESMRRILVEQARRKGRLKHGGGRKRHELGEGDLVAAPPDVDLLALDEALQRLAAHDSTKADLVKLTFFAGLPIEQAAAALGISRATAYRYWTFARAWLFNEIMGEGTLEAAPAPNGRQGDPAPEGGRGL